MRLIDADKLCEKLDEEAKEALAECNDTGEDFLRGVSSACRLLERVINEQPTAYDVSSGD